MSARRSLFCCCLIACCGAVEVVNHSKDDWQAEPIRLPAFEAAPPVGLQVAGEPIPYEQVQAWGGTQCWALIDCPALSSVPVTAADAQADQPPAVRLVQEANSWLLDNGRLALRVPLAAAVAPPVSALRLAGGDWTGRAGWLGTAPDGMTVEPVASGQVFAALRLRYQREGTEIAVVELRLEPGRDHLEISERFRCSDEAGWVFATGGSWAAEAALVEPFGMGFGKWREWVEASGFAGDFPPTRLAPGQTRMGDTLLMLSARWSQAYDDGWFAIAHDGTRAIGAMAVHAGSWYWPHENRLAFAADESGTQALIRAPWRRGARRWFLLGGPVERWQEGGARHGYAMRYAHGRPSQLCNDYLLDWPESYAELADEKGKRRKKPLVFSRRDPFNDGQINPTGMLRQQGRNAIKDAARGKDGWFSELTHGQWILHPDTYGSYWLGWSPENPNFFTDLMKVGVGQLAQLSRHPAWPRLREQIIATLRTDLYHSVTLPGGAGQECPGYLHHALHQWHQLAPMLAERCDIDLTSWPRYGAAVDFLARVSTPQGPRRDGHPAGDSHPGKPDPVVEAAEVFGRPQNPAGWRTEDLPGFGVVFRHRPASARETFCSFKAGPNRGHYHGDQLSLHLCADSHPLVIDHHCSYNPRAGQEHMHNRLSVSTAAMPYANMDGYERLLAFAANERAAVAIAEVQSPRIRPVQELPPERWDWRYPQQHFDEPLTYRRTVVHLTPATGRDCFIVRDQYQGPALTLHQNWHVVGSDMQQDGSRFTFPGLVLDQVVPAEPTVERLDWQHDNGQGEQTVGLRLRQTGATATYVTVLQPQALATEARSELRLVGALQPEMKKKRDEAPAVEDIVLILRYAADGGFVATQARIHDLRHPIDAVVRRQDTGYAVDLDIPSTKKRHQQALQLTVTSTVGDDNTITGSWQAGDRQGPLTGRHQPSAPQPEPHYLPAEPFPVEAIAGGVQVGEVQVRFDDDGAVAVHVSQADAELLALPRTAIDPQRSQGEVGLFVPDAGYPFGPIPDWLKEQRMHLPDWFKDPPEWRRLRTYVDGR